MSVYVDVLRILTATLQGAVCRHAWSTAFQDPGQAENGEWRVLCCTSKLFTKLSAMHDVDETDIETEREGRPC